MASRKGGGWNKKFRQIEQELFPEANIDISVGWCGTGVDATTTDHILQCHHCVKARTTWRNSIKDITPFLAEWAKPANVEEKGNIQPATDVPK